MLIATLNLYVCFNYHFIFLFFYLIFQAWIVALIMVAVTMTIGFATLYLALKNDPAEHHWLYNVALLQSIKFSSTAQIVSAIHDFQNRKH
jgi:hypothetical protein